MKKLTTDAIFILSSFSMVFCMNSIRIRLIATSPTERNKNTFCTTLLGGMAKVTIKKDFKGARIVDFDMETLVTDYRLGGVRVTDYFDIITTYPWSKYSRAIAESGNIGNGNANFNLDYMFQLQAEQAAQVHEARQKAGLE